MPHTTTKNRRSKRPDTRPNAKTRAKAHKSFNDQLKIQDIRVTRKLKGEKKERAFQQDKSELTTLSKEEKLLRALKKKLRGINELLQKKENGDILNAQQLEKIEQLDTVLEDMEALMKTNPDRSRSQNNEDELEENEDEPSLVEME